VVLTSNFISATRKAQASRLKAQSFRIAQSRVGAAEGCDLLIFSSFKGSENQDQKIAAFGSSYNAQCLTGTIDRYQKESAPC